MCEHCTTKIKLVNEADPPYIQVFNCHTNVPTKQIQHHNKQTKGQHPSAMKSKVQMPISYSLLDLYHLSPGETKSTPMHLKETNKIF